MSFIYAESPENCDWRTTWDPTGLVTSIGYAYDADRDEGAVVIWKNDHPTILYRYEVQFAVAAMLGAQLLSSTNFTRGNKGIVEVEGEC